MRNFTVAAVLLIASAAFADTSVRPVYPPARASYAYRVKVHDFYGAEGFGLDCYLEAADVVVVYRDDFGSQPKELFRKALTADEQKHWTQLLARLPIETMRTSYVDPRVSDGLQMTFDFKLQGRPPKRIVVANAEQKELASLCDELNRLLPAKPKLRRPQAW